MVEVYLGKFDELLDNYEDLEFAIQDILVHAWEGNEPLYALIKNQTGPIACVIEMERDQNYNGLVSVTNFLTRKVTIHQVEYLLDSDGGYIQTKIVNL